MIWGEGGDLGVGGNLESRRSSILSCPYHSTPPLPAFSLFLQSSLPCCPTFHWPPAAFIPFPSLPTHLIPTYQLPRCSQLSVQGDRVLGESWHIWEQCYLGYWRTTDFIPSEHPEVNLIRVRYNKKAIFA